MKEHNWINLPSSLKSDMVHWWCSNCGCVRLEFVGEADPYEYFVIGKTPNKEHGWYVGETDDPGCQ